MHRAECTEQSAQSRVHRAECTEQREQSSVNRADCTEQITEHDVLLLLLDSATRGIGLLLDTTGRISGTFHGHFNLEDI